MPTGISVLVVEDSNDDAELIYRELSRAGLEPTMHLVETQPDLVSALESGTWDIVITDYRLQGFNALAVIDTLQTKGLSIPIIMVSGGVDDFGALAALSKGALDYVPKDHLDQLGDAVRQALNIPQ